MATFSLHARRAIEAAKNAGLLKQLALEDGAAQFERPRHVVDGGDERTLRGIPAIGRNVGGAIPGTRPDRIGGSDDGPMVAWR